MIDNSIAIEGNNTPSDPCVWIDHMSTIFRTMGSVCRPETKQPPDNSVNRTIHEAFLEVVHNSCMPVIGRVMAHYYNKSRVMERTTRLARFIVRGLGEYVKDILPCLASLVIFIFILFLHTCYV